MAKKTGEVLILKQKKKKRKEKQPGATVFFLTRDVLDRKNKTKTNRVDVITAAKLGNLRSLALRPPEGRFQSHFNNHRHRFD